ncbi:nucleotidyl transferase AbiEii/AbiGii toxin family protein [Bradyrhizobium australafricanum]|uniref:nucleotidyl transferase AbiEii/AbiGii toxin family protein n=1 Tax=Bradyrhizobium australafricanum TaxID=2821406 RepID=UPI0028A28F22|nr:nucleotidyl transferase AbiEii/AbiGii toxin family protein [Bradyrhizobium australafricanum]
MTSQATSSPAHPRPASGACFALKGGTAINLFVRDLPRLSVDIDLTYLPVAPRPESLADIDAAMNMSLAGSKPEFRMRRLPKAGPKTPWSS